MEVKALLAEMEKKLWVKVLSVSEKEDEVYINIEADGFPDAALFLHKKLKSSIMSYFAVDERAKKGFYEIYCSFLGLEPGKWFFLVFSVEPSKGTFPSLAHQMAAAGLFEREIREQFGLTAEGNSDLRRLRLHEETWPESCFPMRKDFKSDPKKIPEGSYKFEKIEGEGIFEVPVGPVHAGIIGPGHFRFSVAGEPIINLEIRLGWTHRGVEKILEGMLPEDALKIAECVSGDSAMAHSQAFSNAVEKLAGIKPSLRVSAARAVLLELERMYNHAAGIGGIAVDVGFSMPNALCSVMKERLLLLNEKLTESRFLKGVNRIGRIELELGKEQTKFIADTLDILGQELESVVEMLGNDRIFNNRVKNTGILKKNVAEDLGVIGLAGRASGISTDLREVFLGANRGFSPAIKENGDVHARLLMRIEEFKASSLLIKELLSKKYAPDEELKNPAIPEGSALGAVEGWRGPVLYWVKTNKTGKLERVKIVDPSFKNWHGLAHCAPGNIVPDFPLCNKSFDLSYSGNDL